MDEDTTNELGNEIDGNPFLTGKRKDGASGTSIPTVDPSELGTGTANPGSGTGSDGNAPKRRGRKPGSKNGAGKTSTRSADISGLEKILFSVHMVLANAVGIEELTLSPDESKELAKAVAEVQSHYDTVIDPKTMAWVQLAMVAGSVYGPRMIAFNIRKKREKTIKKPAPDNTIPFPHAPTG